MDPGQRRQAERRGSNASAPSNSDASAVGRVPASAESVSSNRTHGTPLSSGEQLPGVAAPAHAAETVAGIRLRSVRGAMAIALRGVGVRALGLVGSVVLARLLLPSDFGVLAFGFTLVAIGAFFTDAGLAAGLIRNATAPTRAQLSALLGLQLSATTVLVGLAAVPLWQAGTVGRVSALMSASLLPGAFRVPAIIQLQRNLDFAAVAIAEVLETAVYTALSIGLVLTGFGVWGVAAATFARPCLGIVVLQRAAPLRVLRPGRRWRTVAPLLVFGMTFQATRAVVLLREQGINVATLALAGSATLGFWTMTQRVMLVPFLLFETMWTVSYPALSRLLESGHDVRHDLTRGLRLGGLLTGLLVVPLAASAPAVVPLVFGQAWLPLVPVVPLAAVGLVVAGPLFSIGTGYLNAIGKVRLVVLAEGATLVPWIIVLLVVLPRAGVLAHGLAWTLASLVEAVILGGALARHARVPVFRALGSNALSALVAGGATYAVVVGREPTVLLAVGAVAASLLIYSPLAALLSPFSVGDLWKVARGVWLSRSN